jgi:hypothetical protein
MPVSRSDPAPARSAAKVTDHSKWNSLDTRRRNLISSLNSFSAIFFTATLDCAAIQMRWSPRAHSFTACAIVLVFPEPGGPVERTADRIGEQERPHTLNNYQRDFGVCNGVDDSALRRIESRPVHQRPRPSLWLTDARESREPNHAHERRSLESALVPENQEDVFVASTLCHGGFLAPDDVDALHSADELPLEGEKLGGPAFCMPGPADHLPLVGPDDDLRLRRFSVGAGGEEPTQTCSLERTRVL